MLRKRKISFLVVPEGGRRVFNLTLPFFWFRLVVGVLGLIVVAMLVGLFFYGRLLHNSSELKKVRAENRRLLEYSAKALEIEKELERNRELTARILRAAGITTGREGGETGMSKAPWSQTLHTYLEPDPIMEKMFPAYVGAMIPGKGTGRIPRGLPLLGYISRGFQEKPELFKPAHPGIDIAVKVGTAVLATASGVVEFAGWDDTYGYLATIDHHNGYKTLYGHNSNLAVSSGDLVSQASIIAFSGNTGRSTGPHLHYEIRKDGKSVDPAAFF